MTKSKKWIIIAAAAAVVVLAAVLVIVLTLPKTRVSSISIGRNEMPRLSYVQGQELDLSEGVLTVSYSDGTTETLALDAEGVEISGYDPDQTGPQTEPPGEPHRPIRLANVQRRVPDAVKLRRTGRQLLQTLGPGGGQVYGLLLFRRYGTLMLLL